ncbi:hypothetical protein WJX84_009099 [Apatococcus fuscideae]|uniref:Aminoglycoside phosphotransferase domain-containing protein n=1 Tax=Apatococcus fuscideae TaxID=2026836 RepID=A0AAW1THP0_9CHLO
MHQRAAGRPAMREELLLALACQQANLRYPESSERSLVRTCEGLVFVTNEHALKFYFHKAKALAYVTWQHEVAAYKALAKSISGSAVPKLLWAGHLPLQEAAEQIACQLGAIVGSIHSMPLPRDAMGKLRTWWHSGQEVWSSEAGVEIWQGRPTQLTNDQHGWQSKVNPWSPFVAWLQLQRARLSSACQEGQSMAMACPAADTYVPADAAVLVGVINGVSGPAPDHMPSWLHEDIGPANILVNSSSSSRPDYKFLHVLDFADGGHGDPLSDIVILHLYTLHCQPALLKSFMTAYRTTFALDSEKRRPPWEKLNGVCPSFRACCYMLMDKYLFDQLAACNTPCDLASPTDIQQAVWGYLDHP